jgi:predicted alpha/beta superfamily hydrolase
MPIKPIQFSPHPFLLAKGISIPSLRRRRKIWAFLPRDYFLNTEKHYPVIYFNDGQNIFEGWKAPFGKSWDVHLTMQKISQYTSNEHILIGIEHGKKYRKGEYLPFERSGNFSFEGNAYSDFVANELKTYVDKNLRTLKDRVSNSIVGSSLGGLNALYTGFKHQDVFSSVGIMSPSLWAAPQIFPLIHQIGKHYPTKFYISAGSKEGSYSIAQINRLYETLKLAGYDNNDLKINIESNGKHDETLWEKEFSNFYQWVSLNN